MARQGTLHGQYAGLLQISYDLSRSLGSADDAGMQAMIDSARALSQRLGLSATEPDHQARRKPPQQRP